jgi:RNA polymerase sigma factor (sigma-70 family)
MRLATRSAVDNPCLPADLRGDSESVTSVNARPERDDLCARRACYGSIACHGLALLSARSPLRGRSSSRTGRLSQPAELGADTESGRVRGAMHGSGMPSMVRARNLEWAGGQLQAEGGSVTIDTQASDADLIARSLAEPEVFTAVFDRHSAGILRYVYARLGPDLAEDVTAETFLAAFRCRDSYDGAWSDARPWLYGIAVRQIRRHRRVEARRLALLRSALADGPAEDHSDRAAERVTAERLRPRLAAAVAALSQQDRELLLLVAWAELSYAEAATALGTTTSAVKARLHRVRVRMRHQLGGSSPMNEEDDDG